MRGESGATRGDRRGDSPGDILGERRVENLRLFVLIARGLYVSVCVPPALALASAPALKRPL
jgi:hypothetical protein